MIGPLNKLDFEMITNVPEYNCVQRASHSAQNNNNDKHFLVQYFLITRTFKSIKITNFSDQRRRFVSKPGSMSFNKIF